MRARVVVRQCETEPVVVEGGERTEHQNGRRDGDGRVAEREPRTANGRLRSR